MINIGTMTNISGTIKRSYVLAFLVIIFMISIAGYGYYLYHGQIIKNEAHNKLTAIADLKAGQIRQWRSERLIDAKSIYYDQALAQKLTIYVSGKNDAVVLHELRSWMANLQKVQGYKRVDLFRTDGKLLLTTSRINYPEDHYYQKCISDTVHKRDVIFADFNTDNLSNVIHPHMLIPIMSADTRNILSPVAVLLLDIDPQSYLYPLIQNWPTTSKSAETLMVERNGNNVVFLNKMRHWEAGKTPSTIPISETQIPAVRAALGQEGIFDGIDYRGVPVLSATKKITGSPWAIVAKIDSSEILEPVLKMAWTVCIAGLLLSSSSGLALYLLWARSKEKYLQKEQEKLEKLNHELAERTHSLENVNYEMDILNKELEQRRVEAEDALENLQKSKDALDSSENKSRTFFELANDAIFIHDYEGNFKEVNRTACERLGYTREELLSLHLSRLDSPEFASTVPTKIGQLKQDKKLVTESVHVCKDGSLIPVEISAKEVNIDGESLVFSIVRDITERTISQQKLLKLSKAVDKSPVTIVITDQLARIEYVNPKFTETSGYSQDEAIGQNPRILKADVQTKEFYREMWDTICAGREWRGEFCNKKKNGDIYWEHAYISPIKDEHGTITNFVAIKEDITDDRRIAKELLAARDAAEAANRSKSEFLANMSHEIRTPLNAIIGFSALTLKSSLPPTQHDYIGKIHSAGELLLNIINDILDFSKIEARQLKMEHIPFRLNIMIANVSGMVQQKVADKGLILLIDTSPDVPACLVGDPRRLDQIILNLLNNSVKFTEHGEVTLETVLLMLENERAKLKFSVRDTGIGLSTEQIARLFQPFTQADGSTTRKFGGTGLGLSISKQLTELMGGEIWCESTEGVGSTFSFTAWFGVGQPGDMEQSRCLVDMNSEDRETSFNFSGSRVLLVEDNKFNQHLAIELLKETGILVDIANNGEEAVKMVTDGNRQYNLVLMDIQMPIMDGYEATRLIRSDSRFTSLPIIAMTAHAMEEERQKIMEAGIDAHITKPINAQVMLQSMKLFLREQESSANLNEMFEEINGNETAIPEIAGLDVAGALYRLDGDKKLYLWVLRTFVESESNMATLIEEALNAGNNSLAAGYAHTIKGTLGSMGAVALFEMAQSLEKAIDLGELTESIKESLGHFTAGLNLLVTDLKSHLQTAPEGDDDDNALSDTVDMAIVKPILKRLLVYIKGRNGKAEHYLDDYKRELAGLPGKKDVKQIKKHLRNFDFAAADEALQLFAMRNGIDLATDDIEV